MWVDPPSLPLPTLWNLIRWKRKVVRGRERREVRVWERGRCEVFFKKNKEREGRRVTRKWR